MTVSTLNPEIKEASHSTDISTAIIGFIIAIALNMSFLTAAYVAVALTFSSTIIIVKLLSD